MSDAAVEPTLGSDSGPDAPLLEVRDLHVTFRSRGGLFAGLTGRRPSGARAVDGASIEIGEGEILALAGESGCGKTTLARSIMGFVKPDSGEIRFDGRPLATSSKGLREHRRQVQMVYQDPSGALNPRQTVYDAVAEGIRIHDLPGDEEDRVADALSRAGLRPPERSFLSYPHQLSGGQRQRVVIAGALALEPRLIVADEPVSAAATRTLNTAHPAMLAATSGRPAPRMVGRRKADSIRVIAA